MVRAAKSLKYVELIWLFLQPMKGTFSDFFARKGMDMPPTSEHAKETTEIKYRTKVVSVVRTIALKPLHYLTSDSTTLKTPSITQFFPKLQGHPPPKKATVVNMCIHLSGPEYKEYIDLTCTRDFGGISPQLLARVARQLFPYKKLGELRQFVQRGPLDLAIPPQKNPDKVPEDGNDRKSMTEWTSAERCKVDLILRSWARWEVDYINGFIKSPHCEGTTTSHDKVCPPCKEIASDQSFKRSLRRVCHFLRVYKFILILSSRSGTRLVCLQRNADRLLRGVKNMLKPI